VRFLIKPKDYIMAVLKSWGRSISGPFLAVIGLVMTLKTLTDTQAQAVVHQFGWLSLAFAGLMVFVAQYRVWACEEKLKQQAQDALNSVADLRGTITLSIPLGNTESDVSCDCANYGFGSCQPDRIKITFALADASEREQYIRIPDAAAKMIHHGERFTYRNNKIYLSGRSSLSVKSSVSVTLVDSLGREYELAATVTLIPEPPPYKRPSITFDD
jgi:hypothetical protein